MQTIDEISPYLDLILTRINLAQLLLDYIYVDKLSQYTQNTDVYIHPEPLQREQAHHGRGYEMADLGKVQFKVLHAPEAPSRQTLIFAIRQQLLHSFVESARPGCLPTEQQIADRFAGISRVPIREALTVLRALGVLSVDRERRQYRATTVSLQAEDNGWRILESEILGEIRTALGFAAERFSGARDIGPHPASVLDRLIEEHEASDWGSFDSAAEIIAINDFAAAAVNAFGLGRTSESLRSHLDILEFSVAHAAREAADTAAAEVACVIDPVLVAQRASVLAKFFRTWLRKDDYGADFVEAGVSQFRNYIECIRGHAIGIEVHAVRPLRSPILALLSRGRATASAARHHRSLETGRS